MPQYNERGEIRGAGGIVIRTGATGLSILMVHRPAFRDWSIPKGKVKAGEDDATAALREVAEETGLHCDLACELGLIHYRDRKARTKVVRYWAMIPREGRFEPTAEVDTFEWLDLPLAALRATRSGERDFLARIACKIRCSAVGVEVTEVTEVHEEARGATPEG